MKAFKAYDIRGVYNRDFDREDVYRIGYFIPKLLNTGKVLIGRDVRSSSEEIFSALCAGITDSGADAVSLGLATTPMVYYATSRLGFDASVQITASHNPKEYNGMKISRTDSLPVGGDSGLKELERMCLTEPVVPAAGENRGRVIETDIKEDYITFLKKYVPSELTLKLSVDCSNGMASLLIKDLLGEKPHYLFDTLDGTFPNHEPNPLEEENVAQLKEAVLSTGSDIGLIFDGDGDRVMFVDERGRFIQPDIITAVLGDVLLKEKNEWVIQDIRTSRSVTDYLEKLGAQVCTWKVGHAFAKLKMRELNAAFGGELAGHYYFRDFYFCDSGILAALIVLQAAEEMRRKGVTFSSYIDSIITYASSGEINFRITRKEEAMEALKSIFTARYTPVRILDIDGYRIEFDSWWFNVRPSNTEPYLRLVAEASDKELLDSRLTELKAVLNEFS
jgi:phosphomannomutase